MISTIYGRDLPTRLGTAKCWISESGQLLNLALIEQYREDSPGRPLPEVCDFSVFDSQNEFPNSIPQEVDSTLRQLKIQLDEYLSGHRREFSIPLAPLGTDFQHRVWEELQTIPFGTTVSYSELAQRLGNPDAVRAVGRANATNPIWIIIPCHRVIGADGSLTGYGGGLDLKRRLLELEGALQPGLFSSED